MTFEQAMTLADEIADFLHECGGPYKDGITAPVMENIIKAVATGQYLYEPDTYFICWWMLDDSRLHETKQAIAPQDISSGSRMYVVECGCQSVTGMKEMKRKIFSRPLQGLYWHRDGRGWRNFSKQRGGL